MTRLMRWLRQLVPLRTLLSLVLLGVATRSIVLGLANVTRELDSSLLMPIAAFGLLLGWGLARSPLPGWLASMVALSIGTETIVVRVGRLGGALLALLQSLVGFLWAGLRWLRSAPITREAAPDPTPALNDLVELGAGVGVLLARLRDWLLALAAGDPAFDPVAAALIWSLALWILAAWASWATRRYAQPLLGVAPGGALLVASLSYMHGNASIALPLLGATLLLMALNEYTARKQHWEARERSIASDIVPDLAAVVIPLSLALVIIAALIPSIEQVVEFAQELVKRERNEPSPLAGSLGLEPLPEPVTLFEEVLAPGLPRSHLLGSGPELERQVVMIVSTDDIIADDIPRGLVEGASTREPPAHRYYWRSLTYDRYTGRGWRTGATETVEYGAGEATRPAAAPVRRLVQQEVRTVGDLGGLLHAAGELVTVDQAYTLAWRLPFDPGGDAGDVFGGTVEATAYQVESLVPIVGEEQLRAAGDDYPDWVRNRYLGLPKGIPARVLARARDLTATEPTPYDRALAIERHLRTFPYNLDIPAPPFDRDVADYFLFDLQQGYCDYYASAMVVLARAAGLPARLAVGYASGTYDAANTRYLVTAADAHSWVEIYFPEFGWVEFEPTAGLPAIGRPGETALPSIPAELDAPPAEPAIPVSSTGPVGLGWLWWWLGLPVGIVALLALGAVTWSLADRRRLEQSPPDAAIMTLHRRLYRYGPRLAVPMRKGDTPHEFAASLTDRISELARQRRWGAVVTPAAQELRRLTVLFVQTRYSAHPPDATDQMQAIRVWQRLRLRLWLGWVWQVLRKNK